MIVIGELCPHCNKQIKYEVQIVKEDEGSVFYITRKEYSVDLVLPLECREYVVLGYVADRDRFKVVRRKK